MNQLNPGRRPWTLVGLAIALFGIPAAVVTFRLAGFTRGDQGAVVVRELAILAMAAVLLWIVRGGERLSYSSIGLRPQSLMRGFSWTLVVMAAFAAVLFVCLGFLLPALGLSYGSQDGPAPSLIVTTLVVLRAGIAEEIFYRGYAIERLEALTGSRLLAAALPLSLFAGFHYSQGIAGIIIAFAIGAAATAIYLWKRNLAILIAAHISIDFIPNVLVPLLSE